MAAALEPRKPDTDSLLHARDAAVFTDPGRPAFEPGCIDREGLFTFVQGPSAADLANLYELTLREIGQHVASFDVVQSVYSHNPFSFWAIWRSTAADRKNPVLSGYWSCLPLNSAGADALVTGGIDRSNPDLSLLAKAGEKPAAIYIWAIVARKLSVLGGSLIARAMGMSDYENTPLYGVVATNDGLRSLKNYGRSPNLDKTEIGSFFEIKSTPEDYARVRALKILEGKRPRTPAPRPRLETVVAATPNQIAKVFAIRAAVFMAEQSCPYDEEFDGNDYSGTHVLGLVDGEPAAVLRMRYFADFVKLERLAVLPKFRRTLIAKLVVEHAIDLARRKGYRRMYGHAQARLVNFWRKFGFSPMSKNMKLIYSDHEYVEMLGEMAAHHDALTVHSDPYVLVRPEGQWDRPGALDRSAARTASNPH
jgi:predicted GNAT family N-acyltransferase